jgi:hypothetical protein
MIRKFTIFITLILCGSISKSQSGIGSPGTYTSSYSVKDCFFNKNFNSGFKSDSIKSNYVLKGVRIWRSVSLENPQNNIILNTNTPCLEISLFEIIKFGIFEKSLHVFSSDNFNETKTNLLSKTEVYKNLTVTDTSSRIEFDENGNEVYLKTYSKTYLVGSDVKSYLMKEDWVLNSYTGKTEKFIIGIAPLVYDSKTEKVVPLFWLYYKEWESLFSCFSAKNYFSQDSITYKDIFNKRYFISQINKESNVFDRGLKDYNHGVDINLETELIKEKLRNAESDLFQH